MSSTLSKTPRRILKREGMHNSGHMMIACPRCRNPMCQGCDKCSNCGFCRKCGCNNSTPNRLLLEGRCSCGRNHLISYCPYHKRSMKVGDEVNRFMIAGKPMINMSNLLILISLLFVIVLSTVLMKLNKE